VLEILALGLNALLAHDLVFIVELQIIVDFQLIFAFGNHVDVV